MFRSWHKTDWELSPLMSYDSVTSDTNRLAQNKNFTLFEEDLAANRLPQWMFITPNMSTFYHTPMWGHQADLNSQRWARHICYRSRKMDAILHHSSSKQSSFHETNSCPYQWDLPGFTRVLAVSESGWQCIAFDETANYLSNNKVFSLLLGDAVPNSAHGTTNSTSFNHYSQMATVEQNWDLGDLGLGDKKANSFYWSWLRTAVVCH